MRRAFVARRAPGRRSGGHRGWRWRIADLLIAIAILALLAVVSSRLERLATVNPMGSARIADGDTLELAGQRIRLRGIDAPELRQTCRRAGADYACGRVARDALRALVAGRDVSCTGWERDRYRRLLAVCSAGATDLNGALVAEGWAVSYGDYAEEEAAARAGRRGLWAGEFERPQDWRISHGALTESPHDLLGAVINWLRQLLAGEA